MKDERDNEREREEASLLGFHEVYFCQPHPIIIFR